MKPNLKFNQNFNEIQPIAWERLTRNELIEACTFNTTCKHCERFCQCTYKTDPCKRQRSAKNILRALNEQQLLLYLLKTNELNKNDVLDLFSNIINIK